MWSKLLTTFHLSKAEYITRAPVGYFNNFLLKTNGKLGGQNSALDKSAFASLPFARESTMMVGIDVNHPAETERIACSVAAAVGSYDEMFSRYNCSILVQRRERDNELVKEVDRMISELLDKYKQNNGNFPKNVIIFRDGVR